MQGAFKKYNREPRIQQTEETFSTGMQFTNAPLTEGFVKELVNLDLKEGGQVLAPRQGLVTTKTIGGDTTSFPFADNTLLVASKSCVEENTKEYAQILTGVASETKLDNSKLYKGDLTAHTLGSNYNNSTYANSVFLYTKPDMAEIHGVKVESAEDVATHVGVFAFNNGYYCFTTEEGNPLVQTKFNAEKDKHEFKKLTPRGTTPKEAVMWGYNMLAKNPYDFECTNSAGAINITGILPYDKDGELIMTPLVNQTLYLKMFYAAPAGAKYNIVWEWKDVIGSTWTEIKKETVLIDNKDLKPLTAEFSAPTAQVMVRVSCFRVDQELEKITILKKGSYEENEAGLYYTGNWTDEVGDEYSGKKQKYSSTKDSTLEFTFEGTGFAWHSFLGPARGKAKIEIDSHSVTIDNYFKSSMAKAIAYKTEGLLPGIHKVKITVLEEKNEAATSNTQVIDYIEIFEKVQYSPTAEQVLAIGFNFNKEDYGTTANINAKKYSLALATGMSYWKNRLAVYGVPEDPTLLFLSELNDPTYFPYPNNTDTFDEPIVHVVALLDNLLVFTATSLYMLALSPDGLSWNKKLIQSNLNINKWDLHLIRTVKNMVFFKSGNYYYMVVPKATSMTGELVIAPISKPITMLLDNFKQNVEIMLKNLYNYKEDIKLVHYYNYLDYEDIHNVYVFKTSDGRYINYALLYNTVSRYWRIYAYETDTILKPFKQDATKKGTLIGINNASNKLAIKFIEYSNTSIADDCMLKTPIFKNYQRLDSGYREHMTDYKKRYREFQLKINNTTQDKLQFYTGFSVDGEVRKDYVKYNTQHIVDPNDSRYGTLTVDREFVDPAVIPGSTILDKWELNGSLFPEAMLWKIRIPVSGKGYTPRIVLMSENQVTYDLLNIAWIYRALYSR